MTDQLSLEWFDCETCGGKFRVQDGTWGDPDAGGPGPEGFRCYDCLAAEPRRICPSCLGTGEFTNKFTGERSTCYDCDGSGEDQN